MQALAIALCRVSTPEQRLNNSLNRQETNVLREAESLGVEIVKWWSGDVSSKAGTNVKRKDLKEMIDFCKANKRVKYMIVDEPDRFMRSIDEAFHFEVVFRELGVAVWYASDQNLNKGDLMSKMLKFSKLLPAEGSNEERQRKSINGHVAAIKQGRYTFPPKPGYMKGLEPGVHQKNPATFPYLQTAFREVISRVYTPTEALKRLNESPFTQAHASWAMDKFRQFAVDPYYAGILTIKKQVDAYNEVGLHEAMLSVEEHRQLIAIFNGSLKIRGPKKQYNPEFPMNKIMTCGDCGDEVKFTGSKKNNGYAKKTTHYYYKYHCRGCGRSYHRTEVHSAVTEHLQQITYTGIQRKEFIEALTSVWEQKQQDMIKHLKLIEKKVGQLEELKSKLVREMLDAGEDYKADLKLELDRVKGQVDDARQQLAEFDDLEQDLITFIKFGLEYTNTLAEDWWTLSHEERVRCQQLIIPGGISFNSQKKVGTPIISPIYTADPNKKDLSFSEKSLMVELAGTAPASVGLSWLVVYRLRSSTFAKNYW